MSLGELPAPDLTLTCPRCQQDSSERFYGPCEACRAQLRETQRGTPSEAEGDDVGAEYEPKMNVTPNAVASKE